MIPNGTQATSESAAQNSAAVTAHDSNEVGSYVPRGLYVGSGGNITLQLVGDTADVVFEAVPTGTFLPISPRLIKATGTTASAMVIVW